MHYGPYSLWLLYGLDSIIKQKSVSGRICKHTFLFYTWIHPVLNCIQRITNFVLIAPKFNSIFEGPNSFFGCKRTSWCWEPQREMGKNTLLEYGGLLHKST